MFPVFPKKGSYVPRSQYIPGNIGPFLHDKPLLKSAFADLIIFFMVNRPRDAHTQIGLGLVWVRVSLGLV